MSTRRNPARLGTKPLATQPHPTNPIDDSSEPPTSGDAVAPSPTARQRRGEPRTARMYQGQNSAPPSQHTQHLNPGIYDENGMPIPDRDSSQASRGGEGDDTGEWLFKELLMPRKDQTPPGAHHTTMRNGQSQEDIIREGRKPVPTTSRHALDEVGIAYLGDNPVAREPYSMDTDPIARIPPDYHYQLTPPTNPLHLASQFNPMELSPDARNPNGTGSIVQSTEHAYALMHMAREAQAHTHIPLRRATVGSAYVNGEAVYATYSDGRPQGLARQQQTSPMTWQRNSSSPGGPWSTQASPTTIPKGWQQASPRNQGQDQSGTQQQHVQSTPPGLYRTQASWAQGQDHSNADRRPTPPSPSPATFWRPGTAPGSGPLSQSAATHTDAHPREISWAQGDPNRPASHPSSTGTPVSRWGGPGPSPVTTANPATWTTTHSMGNTPSNNGGAWQTQGAPPRSAGPLQHQPHPTIDGPSDDGMRWSGPNSTTESVMSRGWQGSSEGSTMASSAGESAGSVVGSAPGQRYMVDESGRPTQVRTHGTNHVRMGSNQMSSMTWNNVQGNPRAPWQMSNPSGTLPLDGRIQTPGGTGAMGGHAVPARPLTATTQITGQYPSSAGQGYQTYTTRPGSVQGQPRPGEYPPAAGNEISYNAQPDSVVAYGTNSRSGGGMPPPPSVASGPPQGYTIASGPPPTGNPYPPVPPTTGVAPYGISRPGMLSQQQQQHHQQPPPNAHGNMYPNYNLHQQQPPPQSQASGPNGSVYAPYTNTGVPPPSLTYPMNPGAPMPRMIQRMPPGNGPMQMAAYSAMNAPQNQPQQDAYNRMGPGTTGTGGMEGYRPQH